MIPIKLCIILPLGQYMGIHIVQHPLIANTEAPPDDFCFNKKTVSTFYSSVQLGKESVSLLYTYAITDEQRIHSTLSQSIKIRIPEILHHTAGILPLKYSILFTIHFLAHWFSYSYWFTASGCISSSYNSIHYCRFISVQRSATATTSSYL